MDRRGFLGLAGGALLAGCGGGMDGGMMGGGFGKLPLDTTPPLPEGAPLRALQRLVNASGTPGLFEAALTAAPVQLSLATGTRTTCRKRQPTLPHTDRKPRSTPNRRPSRRSSTTTPNMRRTKDPILHTIRLRRINSLAQLGPAAIELAKRGEAPPAWPTPLAALRDSVKPPGRRRREHRPL